MRVLHVIPSVAQTSGGPAQAIVPMCRALKASGVDLLLATTDADLDNPPPKNTVVDYEQIPTIFFESQFGQSFKFSRGISVWLRDHVRQFDLAHIHAVFNHSCVAAVRACQKSGVPYIIRPLGTLDSWSMNQKKLRKQMFWKVFGEKMLRGAICVHYTTSAEQVSVERAYDLTNGRVIPLGIEPGILYARSELSARLPEVNGCPYILVLSRLHPKKALNVLIDAFLSVTSTGKFQEWRLVIAGDGTKDYVRLLHDQVQTAHASNRVLFTGWLNGEEKSRALTKSALLALPSFQENFGICVVEALMCGVPVLLSRHVNLADDVRRAGAGWVTEVDRASIESALREALANEEERRRRGVAGKLLSEQFSVKKMVTELIRLYSSVTVNSLNGYSTVSYETSLASS